jgi:nitrite reductase (NADH) large subunit
MVAAPEAAAEPGFAERPIVIVGSGPVGVRVASELHRRRSDTPIVLYGAEPDEPYNRVRLSSLLAGEIRWEAWRADSALPNTSSIERRFGCPVRAIERDSRCVVDARGRIQPFSRLVIATGSTPVIPNIPGIDLTGIYTFRDLRDVQQLFARRMRSRRIVVIGGGLLGLEAARAMRRFNTEVTVVEHAPRLMPRQLDDAASAMLAEHLARLGIRLRIGSGVKRVVGNIRLEGVQLMDGSLLECDTIIVAAGIRPNVDLALRAGLSVGRGIRVDDALRTSDPSIYAVGECAEHRDIVYGLVAPGFEQAAVAAANLAGQPAAYRGSLAATRLKVLDLPVFSIGRVTTDDLSPDARCTTYREGNAYCKVAVERRRIVGAVAIGNVAQLGRLQEAVVHARVAWPWQLRRMRRTGSLWTEDKATHISQWPDSVTVCNCTGVTRGTLRKAMTQGACDVVALCAATGASSVCGSCRPLLAELCGKREPLPALPAWRSLLALTLLAAFVCLLLAQPATLDYAASIRTQRSLDFLWRDGTWKQISGFTVLGLAALALLMSLRKRVRALSCGGFAGWRIAHLALGTGALLALFVHTGGRMGSYLDAALMSCFVALALVGTIASAILALQHRIAGDATRLRSRMTWIHILLFWPVPLLLGFHVFKSYYF